MPLISMSFDDTSYRDQFSWVNDDRNISIVSSPAVSGRSMRHQMLEGQHKGAEAAVFFEEHGVFPEEAWARFYLRFSEGFEVVEGGGKLPGWSSNYEDAHSGIPADGTNKWSARGGFRPAENTFKDQFSPGDADPATVPIELTYYVYHADMNQNFGEQFHWDGEYQREKWYKIDQYAKVNTPGEADGVLRAWVDDTPVFNRTDLRMRDRGHEDIKIRTHKLQTYYGGGWPSPADNFVFFDEYRVSTDGPIDETIPVPEPEPDPGPAAPFTVSVTESTITIVNTSDDVIELRDLEEKGIDLISGRTTVSPGGEVTINEYSDGTAVVQAYDPESGVRIGSSVSVDTTATETSDDTVSGAGQAALLYLVLRELG